MSNVQQQAQHRPPALAAPTPAVAAQSSRAAKKSVIPIAVAPKEKASGTPRTMAILSGLSIVTALLFAVFGALAVNSRANALVDARLHSEQLVRIQEIRTNLVQADAAASNGYLVGTESSAQREDYTGPLTAASGKIADAAANSAPDAIVLEAVNDTLTQYTGLIESARANNRQGFPAGRAYLKEASLTLREKLLPLTSDLAVANDQRVRDAYAASDRAATLLWLAAAAAVVVLSVSQLWLLIRTRRIINIPLAAATGAVVIATIFSGTAMLWAQDRGATTRDGAYEAMVAVAQARTSAFDAKGKESETLIAEGSGQVGEAAYSTFVTEGDAALARATKAGADNSAASAFAAYQQVHTQIRELDDNGRHADAVRLATTAGDEGANKAFDRFDTASRESLVSQADRITNDLSAAEGPLLVSTWLIVIAGLLAAVAAWWGFAVRLEEYR